MNRKERRAAGLLAQKKPTYNFTEEQLELMFQERLNKEVDDIKTKMVNQAFILMMTIPCEVLMDHFWPKSYHSKMKKFAGLVADYYVRYQEGELDLEEMKKDLWEYGGVRFEETDK